MICVVVTNCGELQCNNAMQPGRHHVMEGEVKRKAVGQWGFLCGTEGSSTRANMERWWLVGGAGKWGEAGSSS
jgi:hypothetical protein